MTIPPPLSCRRRRTREPTHSPASIPLAKPCRRISREPRGVSFARNKGRFSLPLSPRCSSRERACSVTGTESPGKYPFVCTCRIYTCERVCGNIRANAGECSVSGRSSARRRFINGPQSSELHQFLPRTLLFRARTRRTFPTPWSTRSPPPEGSKKKPGR